MKKKLWLYRGIIIGLVVIFPIVVYVMISQRVSIEDEPIAEGGWVFADNFNELSISSQQLITNTRFIEEDVMNRLLIDDLEMMSDMDEADGTDEVNEVSQLNEVDSAIEINNLDEISEINAIDTFNKVNQINEINEVNNATLALLRSQRYGYFSSGLEGVFWQNFTGGLPSEYIKYFQLSESEILTELIQEMSGFIDPVTGEEIDFIHMMAVIDAYRSDFQTDEESADYEEDYYDYLLSWGGDLETFKVDLLDYVEANKITDYEAMYDYAYETIGSRVESYFSQEDFLADIDGVNIADLMAQENLLLADALELYYTSNYVNNRYAMFIDSFGGEEAFVERVHLFINYQGDELEDEALAEFIEDFNGFKSLMMRYSGKSRGETTAVENKALEEAFIDLIVNGVVEWPTVTPFTEIKGE
jgi:hypothetical protein